jgi:hypothetical protein
MNANVKTTSELKKLIRVDESWLGREGLELAYFIDHKERFYEFTRLEACKLLRACGMIENYSIRAGDLIIQTESIITVSDENGEPREMTGKNIEAWEDFIWSFHLSQYDAICIAAHVERESELAAMTNYALELSRKKHLNS